MWVEEECGGLALLLRRALEARVSVTCGKSKDRDLGNVADCSDPRAKYPCGL